MQLLPTLRIAIAIVFCLISFSNLLASDPMIVAHRGASGEAPENTLSAFRLAWQQGADAIEGDFYLTSDQQIVCIHDKTTKRVAVGQKELIVAKTTFAELRRLDVGRWKGPKFANERIPSLTEVLNTVPDGKKIFVEIKCGPEILPVLQKQLSEAKLQAEQVVIICFNEDVIKQARLRMPQHKANWLTSFKNKPGSTQWTPTSTQAIETLRRTNATGLGVKADLHILNVNFAKAIEAAGKEFHVWTVNEPDKARQLDLLEVDSITTDYPARIREAITPQSATK